MINISESEKEPLKHWISETLKALPGDEDEVDHEVLGDYVIALLQNEESEETLKTQVFQQLNDFLHSSTELFVTKLFEALKSKSFLSSPAQEMQDFASRLSSNRASTEAPNAFNFNSSVNQPAFIPQGMNPQGYSEQWGNTQNNSSFQFNEAESGFDQGFNNNFNNNRFNNSNNRFNNTRPNNNRFNNNYNNNNRGFNNNFQNRRNNNLNNQGNSQPGENQQYAKKQLMVEKLPEDKFNENDLREYFSQFGEISSVKLDVKQHLAELEFSTHEAAQAAYTSPSAVFGNRFVKLYWNIKEGYDNDSEKNSTIDVESLKEAQIMKQKEWEEKQAKLLENENRRKELLEKQIQLLQLQKDQSTLLLKIAEAEGTPEDVESKKLADNAINVKLEALKRDLNSVGLPIQKTPLSNYRGGYRGRGRGRGGYAPYSPYSRPFRGRGGYNASRYTYDARPKVISVSPVPADKEETLRGYLMSIGEYEKAVRSSENPDSVLISFKDRSTAESLFYGSRDLPEIGNVSMNWVSGPSNTASVENDTSVSMNSDVTME